MAYGAIKINVYKIFFKKNLINSKKETLVVGGILRLDSKKKSTIKLRWELLNNDEIKNIH